MTRRSVVPAGKQRVRVAEGVYLKASGRYLATFRDPGRKQHRKEFNTQKEAVRWRAQALVNPDAALAGKRLLVQVWDELLANLGENLKGFGALWSQRAPMGAKGGHKGIRVRKCP